MDLIKAGGSQMQGESLENIIRHLSAKDNNAHHVLIFGGGPQIDEAWQKKHPHEARTKIDGIGVTDQEVLADAVVPAFYGMRRELKHVLPGIDLCTPDDVRCRPHADSRFGLVGDVVHVDLSKSENTGVGFVGVDQEEILRIYNVNGDSVLSALVRQFAPQIRRVLLLTGTNGILDYRGNVVPVLSQKDITDILAKQHNTISVSDGMQQKLLEIHGILNLLPHVHIMAADNLNSPDKGTVCQRAV